MTTDDFDRFWAKVGEPSPTGCWPWTSAVSSAGYGFFRIGGRQGRMWLAHRVAYELLVGPIPDGLHLDHLCRHRLCVNPAHLEPVTPHENNRRAGAAKTHCPHGHLYDDANTRINRKGHRICRACHAAAERARRTDRAAS